VPAPRAHQESKIMSIGSIGKVGGLQPNAVTGSQHSPRGAFQQLAQLLEGGKLSAAQTAVATVKNLLQQASPAASPAATTRAPNAATNAATNAAAANGSSTLGTDLQSLSQALKSGDVTSARSAFAKFAADARAAGAFAHHRHGGDRMITTDSTAAPTGAEASIASNTNAATGWLTAAASPANAANTTDGTRYRTLNVRA
jgi:hypothetical protein